ncbi:MAG: restriction endonuclease subunit S [Lachnobacterium sp.]|nr:restriction endonuclease subunit S [Lachnobacterium sp.]
MGKPKIRFKGYTDDWEQRKLPEFVSFFNGLTYTPDDVQETGTLVLRSSNVKNGEIVDADNVYVSDEVVTSENVKEGDIIVVVRNGSRALIGKHAQIKASMPNTVIGAFMSGIRSEHSSFVNALLDTSAFENEIAKSMGATINQITGYMFSKMEFMIPSGEEQDKIGAYFKQLDHLITLHQRKCDETKELKKFMLQKMFPKNGEKKPEIRFEGFTDDWEQRKFSDIATRESSVYTSATDIPSVEYEDVVAEEGRLNKDIRLKETIKSGIIFDGSQVLYGKLRPYLHNWLNPDFKGVAVGDWWVLKPVSIDKNFLYRLIQTQQFDNIANQSSGSKMPRADWKLISNSEFMTPLLKEEQSKIGGYFNCLDHLITLHQNKCDELKKIKKFMLQNMFV